VLHAGSTGITIGFFVFVPAAGGKRHTQVNTSARYVCFSFVIYLLYEFLYFERIFCIFPNPFFTDRRYKLVIVHQTKFLFAQYFQNVPSLSARSILR
jgi:hypothetical protein